MHNPLIELQVQNEMQALCFEVENLHVHLSSNYWEELQKQKAFFDLSFDEAIDFVDVLYEVYNVSIIKDLRKRFIPKKPSN